MLDRILIAVSSVSSTANGVDEDGQSTAEYALVIVAAAAIVGLLLSWITKSNGIGSIFNGVIGKVLKWIT